MKKSVFFVGVVAFFLLGSGHLEAALIEVDYLTPGDGLLILDTATNREWVDVTKTTNMSVNQFLTTSIYAGAGFQLATTADIREFFTDAGATDFGTGTTNYTAGNLPAALLLYSLMEHAYPYADTGYNPWVHGFEDYGDATKLTVARFIVDNYEDPSAATTATFDFGTNGMSWTYDSTNPAVGIFAYRTVDGTVPEPTACAIWALFGALGVARTCRRRGLRS